MYFILYIFLLVAPDHSSQSLIEDPSINSRDPIIAIAQTTLYHIKQVQAELAMTSQRNVSSPSLKGLNSIIHALGLLENELQTLPTAHLSQIRMDVSSLEGRVRSRALTLNCPIQGKPTAKTRAHLFPDSSLHHTLTRVENYLEKLINTNNKLKVC